MPETPFELPGTGLRLSHPVRSLDRLLLKGGGKLRFHEYDDDDKLIQSRAY
jgi:hypothetical protein